MAYSGQSITPEGRSRLEDLLRIPEGGRNSWLDRLRRGPVRVSAPALVRAIVRLQSVRDLGIKLPTTAHIPPSRLASLARFANKLLEAEKAAIEEKTGPLDWMELPTKQDCRIIKSREQTDIENREEWPTAFTWLSEYKTLIIGYLRTSC